MKHEPPGKPRRRTKRNTKETRAEVMRRDLVAGTSVALILIPQSMAYAELAGLPAHYGLYAAALPPIGAAIFASSPYLHTGPVALTALLTFGALIPMAPRGSAEYVGLAALLALVVGAARLLIGLLRAGGVAYLMSQPVIQGFTSAAAILIVLSQVPTAVGVIGPGEGVVGQALWALTHPGQWQASSIGFAAMAMVVIMGARRINPSLPGVLFATTLALVISTTTQYGGSVLGEIPARGIPGAQGLPWLQLPSLLIPGLVIAVVGFAETTSISQTFAAQDRKLWDPNREFVSQGMANVISGLSGGFPVEGSFSRSSLNRSAGARTRWSGAASGVAVLIFLPFASVLAPLPRAVLAAIVITAVATLVRVGDLIRIWRFSRLQAMVGWTTFVLTLLLVPRVEEAILVGVVLSLAVHLWRERKMRLSQWTTDGALHLAPRGVLWFGSAPILEKAVARAFVEVGDLRAVVFHLDGVGRLDFTGALLIERIMQQALDAGLETRFDGIPPHAEKLMQRVFDWTPPHTDSLDAVVERSRSPGA